MPPLKKASTGRKRTKRHDYVPMSHRKKKKQSSSTPGKMKVTIAAMTPMEKCVCKRARSYKWRNYDDTFKKMWKRSNNTAAPKD